MSGVVRFRTNAGIGQGMINPDNTDQIFTVSHVLTGGDFRQDRVELINRASVTVLQEGHIDSSPRHFPSTQEIDSGIAAGNYVVRAIDKYYPENRSIDYSLRNFTDEPGYSGAPIIDTRGTADTSDDLQVGWVIGQRVISSNYGPTEITGEYLFNSGYRYVEEAPGGPITPRGRMF